MSYEIVVEENENYVVLSVAGESYELDGWSLALSKATNLCKSSKQKKLLIKDLVVNDYSFFQMEQLINILKELDSNDLKVSVYIANPVRQFTNYFGESVANRQGINLKVFISLHAAVNWLSED